MPSSIGAGLSVTNLVRARVRARARARVGVMARARARVRVRVRVRVERDEPLRGRRVWPLVRHREQSRPAVPHLVRAPVRVSYP